MPFGFLKRKDSETPVEQPAMDMPLENTLSINQAQDLLRNIESGKVKELSSRLSPIKGSAEKSLNIIGNLASDMENEKIKLEGMEQRFKSVAENSRRTVVSTLRREAATELSLPQTANDVKKFKEKFEAMLNRLSEVSNSHSRVITAFMKKHAGKMRQEFESLTKLSNEAKLAISDFDQGRAPIIKCNGILNTASQKVSSIRSAEDLSTQIEMEIQSNGIELQGLKNDLAAFNNTPEFNKASAIMTEAGEIERRKEQCHLQLANLFSPVSRALTKYSYGLTRETESRLQLMSEEPWKILYEKDISSYSALLIEIRKSISLGKIQLKDSEKVVNYLDLILKSLPEIQVQVQDLLTKGDALRLDDNGLIDKAKEFENRVTQKEEELARNRQNLELQKRLMTEKKGEVDILLKDAGDILTELASRRYSIKY